jgi:hypothetical protein
MTFVPGGNENVAVCRLPVVTAVAGVPPSKIHSYRRIVEVAPDTAVKITVRPGTGFDGAG